jgi:hypothetical protein
MSLRIDSRKNRSSSTTDTNSFFITPPLAVSLEPAVLGGPIMPFVLGGPIMPFARVG